VREVGTLIFLGINAWMDIRKREISLLIAAIFAVAGAIGSIVSGRSLLQMLIPMGIVLIFLGLSVITNGAVGMGDVWILLALGLMMDTEEFLGTLCIGMLLAGGWSLILLVIVKKNRHTEIPFVPFLLAGYMGGLIRW